MKAHAAGGFGHVSAGDFDLLENVVDLKIARRIGQRLFEPRFVDRLAAGRGGEREFVGADHVVSAEVRDPLH